MQNPPSSTRLLRKYFPQLCISSETREDSFCIDFSIAVFSPAINKEIHAKKSHALGKIPYASDLLGKIQYAFHGVGCSGSRLSFVNAGRLAILEAYSSCRIDEGGDGFGEERSFDVQVAVKEKESARKNSWNEMPKFLLAGAVSTIISRTCVAPLERIKLEFIIHGSNYKWTRIIRSIWAREGLLGFWKGNALNLFRMVPFKSINFICYDMYCDWLLSNVGAKGITNHDRLIGGAISGLVATALCLPLDTIRTRLIAPGGESLGGVVGCFLQMIRNEGFLSLYKGLTPALISMGPSCAIFYAIYDILKTSHLTNCTEKGSLKENQERELGVVSTLMYGAIAGVCAETATYPLEVIRRQLQLQQAKGIGLLTAFVKLVERQGLGSLFAGLAPSTLQVLPSASLSYLFYEMMKSFLKIN